MVRIRNMFIAHCYVYHIVQKLYKEIIMKKSKTKTNRQK